MPILENGSIEYSIPENIKNLITPEFCKLFMKELHMIWGFSLEDFDYDSVGYCEGTAGWYESFTSTCRKLKQDELYKYYLSLPWYDSDIFDYELTQILVSEKLLLPESETDEIAKQLGISSEDICVCDQCGKYFRKTDVVEKNEEDIDYSIYVCKHCEGIGEAYPVVCDTKKAIHDILGKTKEDYFVCDKCGKIHSINHKGEKYCLNCEQEMVPDTNVNYYYREGIIENEKYHDSLIPKHFEYKDYQTDMIYSYEDDLWYGTVKTIKDPEKFKDLISFHSLTRDNREKEFQDAVEDYLQFLSEIPKID